MHNRKYRVAVVGATGLVGREMVSILEERDFPVSDLIPIASERSAEELISFRDLDYTIQVLKPEIFEDVDIALFSAGGEISKEYAPIAASKGAVVIDNTSAFRMEKDIPLVVPEVNPEDISGYKERGIIANPNCSTIQMLVALKPIYDRAGIKRIVVSTYQSVSGAGKQAVEELSAQVRDLFNQVEIESEVFPYQIAFNCLPHIDQFESDGYSREEKKMINETRKIFHDEKMKITATAVRVPVFCSHSESVNLELEKELNVDDVKKLLSDFSGITLIDDLSQNHYPTAVDATGTDDVFVGRIRRDPSVKNGIDLWIVADNLRKGAALNAVQIAELLIRDHLK